MAQPIDIANVTQLAGYLPLIAAATLSGIGLFVLGRNRKAVVNRLFAAAMLALAGADTAWFFFAQSSGASSLVLWQRTIVAAHIVMLPIWYLFSLTFGSTGIREGLRRQRYLAWGVGVVSLFFLCLVPTDFVIQGVQVRYDGSILFPLGWAGKVLMVASLALLMIILSNLEMTFRHADRQTRWKIKFLVLGVFGILGFHIFWLSQKLLHSAIVPDSFVTQSVIHVIAGALVTFSLVRHRLLDVDVFVSRYVVYRSLTLLLVGAYLLLLGIGREAVRLLGVQLGDWASAAFLIIGGLALTALLLADGFQRRVKGFIDTHFYKNKYDYRKEWLSLTERLARAVTVDEAVPRIIEGLVETMWIGKAGIYLLDGSKTHLRLASGIGFGLDEQVLRTDRDFIRYASEHVEPIDTEGAKSTPFRRAGAGLLEILKKRDVRIAVPMVVQDEVLGLLVVGPELSGQGFRPDDYDLCRTVAAQAATVIMNARMTKELVHGREIRAFAEMSSFIIHDVKNCAHTLSLVASNAEAHIHNPAFQQDAIRAIRQSVEKMQGLLRQVAAVRQRTLRREPVNLNDLVKDSLHALAGAVPGNVRMEIIVGHGLAVLGDAEQLEAIIRNLTMNAIEAINGEGEIRIQTFQDGDEAVLVVSDNGCGMSDEFMNHSLFRPFRSTKGGLGIGLYQCKQVAEAHGGRLEVESIEGRGTTCVLRLPINGRMGLSETPNRAILQGQTTL